MRTCRSCQASERNPVLEFLEVGFGRTRVSPGGSQSFSSSWGGRLYSSLASEAPPPFSLDIFPKSVSEGGSRRSFCWDPVWGGVLTSTCHTAVSAFPASLWAVTAPPPKNRDPSHFSPEHQPPPRRSGQQKSFQHLHLGPTQVPYDASHREPRGGWLFSRGLRAESVETHRRGGSGT